MDSQNYFSIEDEEEKKYLAKLEIQSNNLIITLVSLNDIIGTKYTESFSLDTLKLINKSFKMYESLDEALEFISEILNAKNFKTTLQKEHIIIELKAVIGAKKSEIFQLKLIKQKFNKDDTLLILCQKIENLNKELQELKSSENTMNQITELLKQYKEQNSNKKYDSINNQLITLTQEISKIKNNENTNTNNDNINNNNSPIITNNNENNIPSFYLGELFETENETNLVKNEIKYLVKKEPKYSKKLFSTVTDGDLSKTFHEKCDNINNTLVIIKAINGKRFGGFVSQCWDINSGYKNDTSSFIFSLDNMGVYENIFNKSSIYCSMSYGPYFGNGCDIVIGNKCLTKKSSYTFKNEKEASFNYSGANSLSGDLDFSVTSRYFLIQQYEVYEIGF